MTSKIEHRSENDRSSKKEDDSGDLGREANTAHKELKSLLEQQKHVDKSASLTGMDVKQQDGSHVKLNELGQVAEVTTATGELRQYKHGADGKLNELKDSSGVWQSSDGKTWHCLSDKTKPDRHEEITVDKRGNCHEKHDEGETVRLAGGTTVERDKKNQVTAIECASGATQHFKYDKNGKVSEFSDSREGTTWKSDNGWFWRGNKGERWEGGLSVNPKDGSYSRHDGYSNVTTTTRPDNSKDITDHNSGAVRHLCPDGKISSVEIGGPGHHKFKFGYSADHNLNEVHEPNGTVWTKKDGEPWRSQGGREFKGNISVDENGTVRYCDSKNNVLRVNPDGTACRKLADGHRMSYDRSGEEHVTHAPASDKTIASTAEAIKEALKNRRDNPFDVMREGFMDPNSSILQAMKEAPHKPESIPDLLKNKTEEERHRIAETYKKLYHSDLADDIEKAVPRSDVCDQALGFLGRKDGETPEADRLSKEAVLMHSQLVRLEGNPDNKDVHAQADEQLRASLSGMNSDQIKELTRQYQEMYHKNLADEIKGNKALSPDDKKALSIYLHGVEKRTDSDVMQLADIALRGKDLQMFQEVFAQTQDGQRKMFLDNGGEERIKQAFAPGPLDRLGQAADHIFLGALTAAGAGQMLRPALAAGVGAISGASSFEGSRGGTEAPDTRERIALDYVHYGKRSVPSGIRESIKAFNTDDKSVDSVIGRMTADEQKLYAAGKALSADPHAKVELPPKQTAEQARHFYKETHEALEDAARKLWEIKGVSRPDALKVAQWEEKILYPGGSFIGQIDKHREGFLQSKASNLFSEIEKMSPQDRERLEKDAGYRKFVTDTLKTVCPDERDQKQVLEVLKAGGRQLNERLDSAGQPADLLSALAHMTKESTADLHKRGIDWDNLSERVHEKLRNASKEDQALADWMLTRARDGKMPDPRLIDAYTQAASGQLDAKHVLQSYEQIRNNTNSGYAEMPPAVRESFNCAFLGKFDEKQRKDLIEHGRLSVEDRLKVYCQGVLGGDDKKALFQDLLNYPPADRQGLANDSNLHRAFSAEQVNMLVNASREPDGKQKLERYAALFGVAADKKTVDHLVGKLSAAQRMELEDKARMLEHAPDLIRSYVLGLGDREHARETLRQLNPAQLERMENDYAIKYGSSFSTDVSKMHEPDRTEFSRLITNRTATDWLHDAIKDHADTNNWAGRISADTVSQSGQESEEARARLQAKIADAARHYKEMSPDEREKLVDNLARALERYKTDKSAAAEVASNLAIAGIAIAGSVPSGGISLSALALAGGLTSTATKMAIMGDNYDSKQLAGDLIGGMIGGVAAGLGPAQVARLLPFGRLVGRDAALATADALKLTGPAQAALERESVTMAQNALRESGEISKHQLQELASKIVKMPGAPAGLTAEQVITELEQNYAKNMVAAVKAELKDPVVRVLSNKVLATSAAAAAGGAVQGTVGGLMQWNPEKGIYENASNVVAQGARSAARAAIGAGIGTAVLTGIGSLAGKAHMQGKVVDRSDVEIGEEAGVASATLTSRQAQAAAAARNTAGADLPGTVPDPPPLGDDYEGEKKGQRKHSVSTGDKQSGEYGGEVKRETKLAKKKQKNEKSGNSDDPATDFLPSMDI